MSARSGDHREPDQESTIDAGEALESNKNKNKTKTPNTKETPGPVVTLDQPAAPEPRADLVGARLSHFRIDAHLGEGGMGVVYLAEDEMLRRAVALKVLPPDFARDEALRRRILKEARSAAAINHPNIATIYEVGDAEGRIFIAMELVRGRSLRRVLRDGRLAAPEALAIARQILSGLASAHDAGLVHRDLKPDNVMVTPGGDVKVLDFGLAKQEEQPSTPRDGVRAETSITQDGRFAGTPSYMSPEQIRGGALDRRSDVFSFGVMLYEMLAGERPFSGDTIADVLSAVLRDEPRPVSAVVKEVPRELSQIVARCLSKERGERYGDCRSILADMARIQPSGERGPAALGAEQGSFDDPVKPRPRGRSRRASAALWIGAAIGALGLLGVGISASRPRDQAPPPASAAPPAPRPTAVTDMPAPASKSPEALALYDAAMQAYRDANGGHAIDSLRRAVALDPTFAAAHLRLALFLRDPATRGECRAHYASAMQGRALLSERDQALLHASEPLLSLEPPDRLLTAKRISELADRYPLDAEIHNLLAYLERDPEKAHRAAVRATEIDPQFADAWQARGITLMALERVDEAAAALDHCVSLSPATADCHGERAIYYERIGRCAEMEDDLRRAISSSPKAMPDWYFNRAVALQALDRPAETVLEALSQGPADPSPERRRAAALLNQATLDVIHGRFASAEKLFEEANSALGASFDSRLHPRLIALRVQMYLESGRAKQAAAAAAEYLRRQEGWVGVGDSDRTLQLARAMLQAGELSKEASKALIDGWQRRAAPSIGGRQDIIWTFTKLLFIDTEDEAREALASAPSMPADALAQMATKFTWSADLFLGKMYLIGGRPDAALPLLRRWTSACSELRVPFYHNQGHFYLGLALERSGDAAGACAAYTNVLERWGSARPRSVTAEKARARKKAIKCP